VDQIFTNAVNSDWTLFLDRDGVINRRLVDDYVKTVAEFEFLPGVLESMANLSVMFGRVVVVTNQQGIAKGFYSHEDLAAIHAFMKSKIEKAGGRTDAIYYAHQMAAENSPMRKPGIGMALQAKKDFPEIDFAKSVMVGDSNSDMEFAKSAGMKSVFVGEKLPKAGADIVVNSLAEFSRNF
jgi:histidinol-phosphate phosphatase family protein